MLKQASGKGTDLRPSILTVKEIFMLSKWKAGLLVLSLLVVFSIALFASGSVSTNVRAAQQGIQHSFSQPWFFPSQDW